MTQKLITLIASAAALMISTAALAQEKVPFYEAVPKHEFFIEGFGGFAPILYTADTYYYNDPGSSWTQESKLSTLFPWKAGDLKNPGWFIKDHKIPVGIGYGAGFGYIYHFTPVWGFMTGAQFAVYNGGIDLRNPDAPETYIFTAGLKGDKSLQINGTWNYYETQQYMAVQVPLMFQVMAPMGKGKNFFYFAFGGKVGFNIPPLSNFWGHGERGIYAIEFPYAEHWTGASEFPQGDNFFGMFVDYAAGKENGSMEPADYFDIIGHGPVQPVKEEEFYTPTGRLAAKLINPMASLEMGFRWRFGGGWGLYTGLYADYGFLPLCKANGPMYNESKDEPQSILSSQGLPTYYYREGDTPTEWNPEIKADPLPRAARFVNSIHAGLKMKLAFGKVKKAAVPVPVVLPPKPDTVVKTVVQTVVVRDTVTQQVEVEVEKIVRDTVVIIKEVPQEIKDVMVELSNTLFAFDKFNLTDKAREGLNKVAKWLNDNPDVNVEISGHTDGIGSDAYNQTLSENRAKSVYEYFIHEGGVSSKRLSYKGYGKSRPIATNDTAEGRQQNRRVELNIIQ